MLWKKENELVCGMWYQLKSFPVKEYISGKFSTYFYLKLNGLKHGLRTPGEDIAFTARPKIKYQSQILGTAEAYFVCHIGPKFQISLIYAFIGCS